MEAFSWLSTALNMLVDIPHCCPIAQNLVMDVSEDQVLKDLPALHLTLWLLRYVCCADKISLSQSKAVAGLTCMSMTKVTSNARIDRPVGVLQRVY